MVFFVTRLFLGYKFNWFEINKILILVSGVYTLPLLVLNLIYFIYNGKNRIVFLLPHLIYTILIFFLTVHDWRNGDVYIVYIILSVISIITGVYNYKRIQLPVFINKHTAD